MSHNRKRIENLLKMEKKYGTEVFLKGLSRRLNYKGIKVIAEKQEPVDSKEDEKAAECSKELVRTSWGDILAYIQESKQCIAREGLLFSIRSQLTEVEVFQAYVPCNTKKETLEKAVVCINEKIEAYGDKHNGDFIDLDIAEIAKETFEAHGIPYIEPFPDIALHL